MRELSAENATLKAQLESKEKTMAAVREETLRNADMLMTAQETRKVCCFGCLLCPPAVCRSWKFLQGG